MSRMIHLRYLGLFVVMLTMFSMSALANSYYSKATATAVGIGKVYVSYNTNTTTRDYAYTSDASSGEVQDNDQHVYFLYAEANEGAEFVGWYKNKDCTGNAISNDIQYKATIKGAKNAPLSPATENYYALFKPKNVHVLYDLTEYSHGAGAGVIHSYTLSGPGETLYYLACRESNAIYYHFYVEYSTDNENWTTKDNQDIPDDGYNDFFSCDIPETARYVRFRLPSGGTLKKYIKNVYVPRKTYVRASSDKTAFGTVYTDASPKPTATFTVDYSTTNGGNITVTSSNGNFSLSSEDLQTKTLTLNVDDNSNGRKTFTVTYTPDPDQLGKESAVITIRDAYHSAETITLTATSQKYETTIARGTNPAPTVTTVDGVISNAFTFSGTSATKPSADSNDDFYYTISHTQTSSANNGEGVISYDPTNNTITGLNQGTARLTIYQKKTIKYNETSQSFDFTVNKLDNNVSMELSATTLNVDETATVQLSGGATDNDGAITVTYKEDDISYTNKLQNRDGGFVTYEDGIKGVNAGVGKITVTQAETYKYLSKSKDFPDFTVNKLPQTLTWYYDEIETYIKKDHTLEGNTARSDADASTFENGVIPIVYSSGNTDVITVDESTGVLTGVAVGDNIVITASQEGNYKYLPVEPLTLTRQFSVTNKQIPVFTPDDDFSGLSRQIEYSDVATITVADVSSGDDFVITEGDNTNTILDVVRSGGTITIKGLKVGNTTLTLTQQGNDGYIGRSKTYNIEVYWPDDFLALSPSSEPSDNIAATYRKVFFNRSFNAGYSTIALPFQTTVAALTGRESADDWVAQLSVVTYTAADNGYTLYFKKTGNGADADGGIIEANRPYVLHLSEGVENPVWLNQEVLATSTSYAVQAEKGYLNNDNDKYSAWKMRANYKPGESMNGRYGIVNNAHLADGPDPEHPDESEKTRFPDGCLKLGGTGSALNAFMAYIEGPTSAPVKAAYLDDDDNADGLLEVLYGEVSGTESVYDLQGRKLPKAGRGLNIIRGADGSVKKVMNN